MAGLFSKPKTPQVTPAAPQPIVDQVQVDRNAADLLRRRRGRAATDLTTSNASQPAAQMGTTGSVSATNLLGG